MVYDLPFSPEKVQKILDSSKDTYQDEVKFTVKFPDGKHTGQYSLEQFCKSRDEVEELSFRELGPSGKGPVKIPVTMYK